MPVATKNIDSLENVRGEIKLSDFSGGLNSADSNEVLKDNEAIVRKNWDTSERGAIVRVNGFTKKNATLIAAKTGLGLFRVYQSDGTRKLVAAMGDGKLYFSDNDGTSWTQATDGTGLSTTKFNSGVNFNNLLFFTNPTDNLQTYTPGTDTMVAATDQPTDPCSILIKRADKRMLALVNTVNGSTLYFTKIGPTGAAADDWSASNDAGSIAIDGALSEPLSGGMTFGAVDIIFKDNKAFKVWGYPNPIALHMPGSPGCAAPHSVVQGEGLGFFLAHDGVWLFDGNKFIKISDKIQPIIDSINQSQITNAFGVYRNGFYWLFYTPSGQTKNQKVIIYDAHRSNPYINKNIWFERSGIAMNSPVIFDGVGDANELYAIASAETGFVYRLDFSSTGADDTANISAIYQTKYFDDKFPRVVKRISKIHIRYLLGQGNIRVTWFTNRGNVSGNYDIAAQGTGVKLGTFLLGTDSLVSNVENTHTQDLPDTAVGKDFSVKIEQDSTGNPAIIRGIDIEWEALYVE